MSVEYALKDGYQRLPKVRMRKPDNTTIDVDEDLVDGALQAGYWKMTPAEVADDDQMRKIAADAAAAWKAEHSGGPVNCHGQVVYVPEEEMSRYLAGGDCVRISNAEAGRLQNALKDEPRSGWPIDETILLCGIVGTVDRIVDPSALASVVAARRWAALVVVRAAGSGGDLDAPARHPPTRSWRLNRGRHPLGGDRGGGGGWRRPGRAPRPVPASPSAVREPHARDADDTGCCSTCGAPIDLAPVTDRDPWEPGAALYADYEDWHKTRGGRPWTWMSVRAELLKRRWLTPYRSGSARGIRGIRLRNREFTHSARTGTDR
jgi:hypothetical protein